MKKKIYENNITYASAPLNIANRLAKMMITWALSAQSWVNSNSKEIPKTIVEFGPKNQPWK